MIPLYLEFIQYNSPCVKDRIIAQNTLHEFFTSNGQDNFQTLQKKNSLFGIAKVKLCWVKKIKVSKIANYSKFVFCSTKYKKTYYVQYLKYNELLISASQVKKYKHPSKSIILWHIIQYTYTKKYWYLIEWRTS